MNYQAFTNDSLTMMYEAVRGALAADDALKRQGNETRFRVRETPDWKQHAADLETEMLFSLSVIYSGPDALERSGLSGQSPRANTARAMHVLRSQVGSSSRRSG
jgi:hypothetical protein